MYLFRDKIGRASSWLFGLFQLFHEMRPDYFVISWDHFETRGINRGYFVAAQRHEISLRELKNISRVSPPFELFYDEFKVTKCCTKTFCLCWVLRSKIAYIAAWVSRFASVTGIIKYVEKLLLFACLVFSRTLCQTVHKFQASSFDELSFFPRAGLLWLVKCDEGRFSGSVFTSSRKP